MGVTLSKIASNTSRVEVSIMGEKINVVYYPLLVTEKAFARLQAFSNMVEDEILTRFKDFNDTLANLIQSWDLYEDEAETVMYPINADRLADLPLIIRMSVIRAIIVDIRPEALAPQTNSEI